ncbi:MAG: D-aminoacylase [Desulfobacterales bacterium]
MLDLIIRNATVIDGSGKPGFSADVAVDQGRIGAVAPDLRAAARRTIDADGLALCPGFIDMHAHSDWSLAAYPRAESRLHQGITTEVVGNCGSTWGPVRAEHLDDFKTFVAGHGGLFHPPMDQGEWPWPDLAAYYRELASGGLPLNWVPLVGHGSLRCAVMGFEGRAAEAAELAAMEHLLRQELDQGLFGMSAGLIYHPGAFADLNELTALAQVVRRAGGLITLHMRSESHGILDAIAEGLAFAEASGVSLEISHLKCELPANWGRSAEILALLDQARQRGVRVDFDQYPYTAYCCSLLEAFPPWAKDQGPQSLIRRLEDPALRRRVQQEMTQLPFSWENPLEGLAGDRILLTGFRSDRYRALEGLDLTSIAAALEVEPIDALFRLFQAEQGGLAMIVFAMCEEDLERILRHPATLIGSDGAALAAGQTSAGRADHPRNYGTFPRILGRYVRERNTLSLETAVAKMSGLPARKLGLLDRGLIRSGQAADLVIFDPHTVADGATFQNPHRYPAGIPYVLVNGELVIDRGRHTGSLPGILLQRAS